MVRHCIGCVAGLHAIVARISCFVSVRLYAEPVGNHNDPEVIKVGTRKVYARKLKGYGMVKPSNILKLIEQSFQKVF